MHTGSNEVVYSYIAMYTLSVHCITYISNVGACNITWRKQISDIAIHMQYHSYAAKED